MVTTTKTPGAIYPNGSAVAKDDVRLWMREVVAQVNAELRAALTDGGRAFLSRDEAVAAGQEALPGYVGLVFTREGNALVMRGHSKNSDDPLFATWPYWGVIARLNPGAAMRDAGVMTLANVAGTGDAITADLPAAARENGVTATSGTSIIEIIPIASNTGAAEPTLSIDGGAAAVIRSETGAVLTAGQLVAGRSYLLRRRGAVWRILSGGVAMADLAAESASRAVDVQASVARDMALQSMVELADQDSVFAGDPPVEAQDTAGQAVSFYDGQGRLLVGDLVTHGHFSGDDAFPIITDRSGRPLVWMRLDVPRIGMADIDWASQSFEGFDWSASFRDGYVGDPIPVIEDAAGNVLIYVDGNNRFVGAGGGGGERPNISFSGPVWNATDDGTSRRWGTRYHGRFEGMEERGGLTLAETGPVAVGMIGYGGGGASMSRPMAEDWRYHIRTPVLSYDGGMQLAEAHCSASAQDRLSRDLAVPTMIAITAAIGSPVASDTAVGSPLYGGVMSDVAQASASLAAWGKSLVVDRVSMSLLGGAPDTSQIAADNEYASIAAALRADISTTTGQGTPPLVVVSPSFGTREGGSTAVSLAEARLDASHPALGFVVAGPRHAYDLLSGSLVALTPESAALQTELEAIAVREVQAGNLWYCPILVSASLSGSVITANFASMTDLELPPGGEHGFSVSGITNGAAIASVAVSGRIATITLSEAPQGSLTLNLAWGRSGTPSDARPINRSDIRDLWSEQSRQIAGRTHYRLALPASVAISV